MEYDEGEAPLLGAVPVLHVCSSYWANPNHFVPEAVNFSGNLRVGRGRAGTASSVVRICCSRKVSRVVSKFITWGITVCPKNKT